MRIKKRTAAVAAVALLVCAAVYLNWSYQKGKQAEVNASAEQTEAISDEARILGLIADVDGTDGEDDGSQTAVSSKIADYFAKLRLTRQQARDEAISVLENTTADESISLEAKEIAVAGISEITNNALIESRIESLVLSKGYADCSVFLSDGSLSVVVAPMEGGLKSEDAIRIKDIAVAESSLKADAIRIIEARITD